NFTNNKALYQRFGIPYHRGYLLMGPPGTGKTSLIHGLASHFNTSLYIITIDRSLDRYQLMSLLDQAPQNSFIVIEDIDALYRDRTSDPFISSSLSFSDFINIVDGLSSREGTILFMTKNHV